MEESLHFFFFLSISIRLYCKEALKKRPTKLQYKGTYPLTKGPKHQRTRQNKKKTSPLTHIHPVYKIY